MGRGNYSGSIIEGTGDYVGAFPSAPTPLDPIWMDVEHGVAGEGGAVPDGLHAGYGPSSIQECVRPGPHAQLRSLLDPWVPPQRHYEEK